MNFSNKEKELIILSIERYISKLSSDGWKYCSYLDSCVDDYTEDYYVSCLDKINTDTDICLDILLKLGRRF